MSICPELSAGACDGIKDAVVACVSPLLVMMQMMIYIFSSEGVSYFQTNMPLKYQLSASSHIIRVLPFMNFILHSTIKI